MEERKAAVPFSEIAADRSSSKVSSHVRLQQYVEKFGERAFCKVFTRPQLQTLCKAYGLQVTARANKSTLTKDLLPLIKESARMPHPYYTNVLQSQVSNNNALLALTLKDTFTWQVTNCSKLKNTICLKLSQENKRTLRFSSYSPAFYVQNKIRLKDVNVTAVVEVQPS